MTAAHAIVAHMPVVTVANKARNDSRLSELTRQLGGLVRGIRLNANGRILLSLRGSKSEGLRLSLHHRLLEHPAALAELPGWVRGNGRDTAPALRAAIEAVFRDEAKSRRADPATVPNFAPLGGPLDLPTMYREVHALWFPHLSMPPVQWGRNRRVARRRLVRFAAYHRKPVRIVVNPVLDQPWVAREFVAYVLYHELCHHAQAADPVRGEKPHSARFKQWEARYPRFRELLTWEKAHLDRFLAAPVAAAAG